MIKLSVTILVLVLALAFGAGHVQATSQGDGLSLTLDPPEQTFQDYGFQSRTRPPTNALGICDPDGTQPSGAIYRISCRIMDFK